MDLPSDCTWDKANSSMHGKTDREGLNDCVQAGDPAGKSVEEAEIALANGHAQAELAETPKAETAAAVQGSDISMTQDSGSGPSLVEEGEGKSEKDEHVVVLSPISPFKANSQKSRKTPKKDKMSNAQKAAHTPTPQE